ncbi:MAG: hypothetical protein ACLVKA_11450 [Collinsella aerofaciens]
MFLLINPLYWPPVLWLHKGYEMGMGWSKAGVHLQSSRQLANVPTSVTGAHRPTVKPARVQFAFGEGDPLVLQDQ